jgi:hypothetical protein
MTKPLWNLLKVSPVVFAATLLVANSALAGETNEKVTNENVTTVAQLSQESNSIGQVTSVSQFSDVQPTDWAFQALQSLVERYGCIAGYPNGTFRGNRALTRYEFAAGLNACLDRVNELIATATADLVTKQDLATLQRLQEEFSAELATLRGRVDALEARTSTLEAQQFSTTTKLVGEAIFSLSENFGDRVAVPSGSTATGANLNSNAVFSDRVRLNLYTSFTGKDRLQTRLTATNTVSNGTSYTGTNETRLAYDGTSPNLGTIGTNNAVGIDKLNYAFNVTDAVRVKIDATNAELYENTNTFNPDFTSSGTGALSRYGRFSPIFRQGVGGAGITLNYAPEKSPINATVAYLAGGSLGNLSTTSGANVPTPGNGIFNGNNTIFGQLGFQPNKAFSGAFTYAHTYQNSEGGVSLFGGTGSSFANNPFGQVATVSDNYGVEVSFQPSAKLVLGGWGGYTTASPEIGAQRSTETWYWAATLAVKDFGKEGNVLGLIFGQPPKVTGGTNIASENDTSYHLEGLYKVKVSDNIQVTPGVIVIFNPENNNNNPTEYVGTLRTTFTF